MNRRTLFTERSSFIILCVEDDAGIRNMMVYPLTAAGYEAVGCPDAHALAAAMAEGLPELILLDIMLPGENRLSILSRLRADPRTAALHGASVTLDSTPGIGTTVTVSFPLDQKAETPS